MAVHARNKTEVLPGTLKVDVIHSTIERSINSQKSEIIFLRSDGFYLPYGTFRKDLRRRVSLYYDRRNVPLIMTINMSQILSGCISNHHVVQHN
jgi:hypothetical protein